jgi:porin
LHQTSAAVRDATHQQSEQGVEAFYNYFITPWLRLTGDLQWVDTGSADLNDAVLAAIRLQTRF